MGIDPQEEAVDAHIGVGGIDRASFALQEVLQHRLQVDVADEQAVLLIPQPGWLLGFAVGFLVVTTPVKVLTALEFTL